ncbi:hypothetical protein ACJMK2_016347 [Sinanodonta woodiana]|uniref:B box-type domain-containing protein n=1 Tax=Sinanodonta woodiana TaxID=1069815 RepID=A0ABD3UTB3_SINWO
MSGKNAKNTGSDSNQGQDYLCKRHTKRCVYFCEHHNVLCCNICVNAQHKHCTPIVCIEGMANMTKQRDYFDDILANLREMKEKFEKLKKDSKMILESTEWQKENIKKIINEWKVKVITNLDKMESDLLTQLNNIYEEEAKAISEHHEEYEDMVNVIDTYERRIDESSTSVDDTILFASFLKATSDLEGFSEAYNRAVQMVYDIELTFEEDSRLDNLMKELRVSVQVNRISPCQALDDILKVQTFTQEVFQAAIPGDQTSCRITSGTFFPDGRILVVDSANRKLKLFDGDLKYVSHLKLNFTPTCVCCVDERLAAVTAGDGFVCLFNVTDSVKPAQKFNIDGCCYDIAAINCRLYIHVLQYTRHLIQVMTTSGAIIRKIPLKYGIPDKMCISPDGKMIYYSRHTDIVRLDVEGRSQVTFGRGSIVDPTGIAVDRYGNLYCCGKRSKLLYTVSWNNFDQNLQMSWDVGLNKPLDICFNDKYDKLLVIEESALQVKLLEIQP